jgi:hypothetical protein
VVRDPTRGSCARPLSRRQATVAKSATRECHFSSFDCVPDRLRLCRDNRVRRSLCDESCSLVDRVVRECEVLAHAARSPTFGMTRDRAKRDAACVGRPHGYFELDSRDETSSGCEQVSRCAPRRKQLTRVARPHGVQRLDDEQEAISIGVEHSRRCERGAVGEPALYITEPVVDSAFYGESMGIEQHGAPRGVRNSPSLSSTAVADCRPLSDDAMTAR